LASNEFPRWKTTEDLGRILASACDDELGPMQRLIEAPAISEVRAQRLLDGTDILVDEGRVPIRAVGGSVPVHDRATNTIDVSLLPLTQIL
jgi:hypothetical protein